MTDANGNNPNIVEHGKNTRFGQPGGADPRKAREAQPNPNSVRACLRRLMTYPVSPDLPINEQLTVGNLLAYLGRGHDTPTLAMMAAIQTYKHGVANGKIMMQMIDQVDGKLIEKKVEASATLEQLVTGEYDDPVSDE